jgi:hypothetical protein
MACLTRPAGPHGAVRGRDTSEIMGPASAAMLSWWNAASVASGWTMSSSARRGGSMPHGIHPAPWVGTHHRVIDAAWGHSRLSPAAARLRSRPGRGHTRGRPSPDTQLTTAHSKIISAGLLGDRLLITAPNVDPCPNIITGRTAPAHPLRPGRVLLARGSQRRAAPAMDAAARDRGSVPGLDAPLRRPHQAAASVMCGSGSLACRRIRGHL